MPPPLPPESQSLPLDRLGQRTEWNGMDWTYRGDSYAVCFGDLGWTKMVLNVSLTCFRQVWWTLAILTGLICTLCLSERFDGVTRYSEVWFVRCVFQKGLMESHGTQKCDLYAVFQKGLMESHGTQKCDLYAVSFRKVWWILTVLRSVICTPCLSERFDGFSRYSEVWFDAVCLRQPNGHYWHLPRWPYRHVSGNDWVDDHRICFRVQR